VYFLVILYIFKLAALAFVEFVFSVGVFAWVAFVLGSAVWQVAVAVAEAVALAGAGRAVGRRSCGRTLPGWVGFFV